MNNNKIILKLSKCIPRILLVHFLPLMKKPAELISYIKEMWYLTAIQYSIYLMKVEWYIVLVTVHPAKNKNLWTLQSMKDNHWNATWVMKYFASSCVYFDIYVWKESKWNDEIVDFFSINFTSVFESNVVELCFIEVKFFCCNATFHPPSLSLLPIS